MFEEYCPVCNEKMELVHYKNNTYAVCRVDKRATWVARGVFSPQEDKNYEEQTFALLSICEMEDNS